MPDRLTYTEQVDADTGELIDLDQPWWPFMLGIFSVSQDCKELVFVVEIRWPASLSPDEFNDALVVSFHPYDNGQASSTPLRRIIPVVTTIGAETRFYSFRLPSCDGYLVLAKWSNAVIDADAVVRMMTNVIKIKNV